MIAVREGVTTGIRKSAKPLTKSLRTSVISSGWDTELAAQLKVESDGKSIRLPSESEAVHDREYGNLDNTPSGAVLQWTSDTGTIETIIIDRVEKQLQGVL